MNNFIPYSVELSMFSHYLTLTYPSCHLVCSYIGRSAFNNFILMFPSSFDDEVEIKVLSACEHILHISETTIKQTAL